MVKNLYKQQKWGGFYSNQKLVESKPHHGLFTSYDIFQCDSFIQKYLPINHSKTKNKPKICEIGSGNGKLVKKFADMLGYKPYGIEYREEESKIARQNGVTILVKDAFDKSVMDKYKNYFDVVFSYGFIEHILPPQKAIKLHIDLVKPGGYFVIQIPRFKGFNLWKLKFFRPDYVAAHNLTIMNSDILEKLCAFPNTEKLLCTNYGTLKLRIPMEEKNIKYYLLKFICSLDFILNPLFRVLFRERGFETNTFSPCVIYIGRRLK